MSGPFARGKRAIAECDRCAVRVKLSALREEVVKGRQTNLLVCRSCWSPDHPQLMLGMYPVSDPQALRNPRSDRSLGVGGSRGTQWGWAPVGGGSYSISGRTPNSLEMAAQIGIVSVSVS